jgi:hypothetical protein
MSSPSSAMSTWAALAPMPGTSSRRCSADSGDGLGVGGRGWSVSWAPVVAAVVPGPEGPAPSPGGWAAEMAPISSWMRLPSRSIWTPSASMWSPSILASSAWWSSKRPVSAATRAAHWPRIRPLASSASTLGHAARR